MELYEKIIIASAMGLYLCFLIYQNRDYFRKHTSKKGIILKNDENIILIRIETQDGSGDFIEIIFPEENKDKNKNDK